MASGSDTRVGQTLILLVILGAAGGWNYHRNTQIDNAVLRPYRNYADEDLQQLMSAYRSEVEVQMERYRNDPAAKTVSVRDAGLLGDQIEEFERVQRVSKQRQERAYRVTENQILAEQLAKEQVTRERDRPIYKMIFRRLTTF
jgi:hypothetical protein